MSNLERDPQETPCRAGVTTLAGPAPQLLAGRPVPLGRHTVVQRFLPHRERRMVGAWCFVDHFGSDDAASGPGLAIPPHPHTGLQTVSWLLAGEILHRDSLGSTQPVRPGQLNLMTAGRGIAHSERSPAGRPAGLHGVQLWIALPAGVRDGPPAFEHHAQLPVVVLPGMRASLLVGELAGARSPATVHTPLTGADVALDAGASAALPLQEAYEWAVVVLTGAVRVDGCPVPAQTLAYLGRDRGELTLDAAEPARLLLLGGEPFEEELVMWWNFVARSHEEIAQARADWAAGRRFGPVVGDGDDPLPAPPMPMTTLRPRGRAG